MILTKKHKLLAAVLITASVILLSLGFLLNALTDVGVNSSSNSANNSTTINTVASNNTETKDAPRFNLFSFLNRFIPN